MQIKIIPAPKKAVFWGETLYEGVTFARPLAEITWKKLEQISAGRCMPLELNKAEMDAQSYVLQILSDKVVVTYGDDVGLHYAVLTLVQIAKQCKHLPLCEITDSPDFASRGLMIDISRNKVPRLETLFQAVDMLSDLKLNALQLYVEGRSFFYDDKRSCYENPDDFLTAEDVAALQDYCNKHFVSLVPNGNSLGHMTYWLSRDEFKHLAFSPDGFLWWKDGLHCPAGTLDPNNPQSKQFVYGLFDKLLQPYSNAQFVNIGGDEPFEFSFGKNKLENEGEVYVNFMTDIVANMKNRGLTPMMWGDIVQKHPECMEKLHDVVFCEWAYTAGMFSESNCENYNKYNARFYVSPSCSLHGCFTGRTDNMLQNITEAATIGKKHGAEGFLNTNWGDGGSAQLCVSEMYAYAMGAAVCWNVDAFVAEDVEDWLDANVYRCKLAKLVGDLGRYHNIQPEIKGGIPYLFSALYIRQTDGINFDKNYSDPTGFFSRDELLTYEQLQQTKEFLDGLRGQIPAGNSQYIKEVRACFDVLDWAIAHTYLCWGLKNINYTAKQVQEVLHMAQKYVATHKRIWFKRNKRSDYDLASYRYKALVKKYKYILKNMQ